MRLDRFISALRAVVCVVICFFTYLSVSAQSIQSLKLTRNYRYAPLDTIIDQIGADLNIRFSYDREYLSRYKTSFMALLPNSKEKSVGDVLKSLRSGWDMVTLVGDDGYIYISRDKAQLVQLRKGNVDTVAEQTEQLRAVNSARTPVKRNFVLTGEILDCHSSERIPYATITVNGTAQGAVTDANGRFTLDRVPADTCTVLVEYIGYRSQQIILQPSAENTPLEVKLEPQPQDIATVFIVGRKEDKALQQYTAEHKIKMAPAALKLLPNIGEKDILRGFQLMPGVSASNESSSGMYVRGGTPDQNLILYDGFTIYYVDHMHGFYSAFNSNAIKDVQLYKGGFSAKYGGRLSSVTEITAKDGNKNKFSAGIEASLLSVNAFMEIPIGDKFTSIFSFRRSYQGYLWNQISGQNSVSKGQTAIEPPKGFDKKMRRKAYFYDLNGKITITPTTKDIISLSVFNGTDNNDNTPKFGFDGPPGGMGGSSSDVSISMDNSDIERYGNLGTSLRWARKVDDRLTMNLLVSFSNFYATRDQQRTMSYTIDGESGSSTSGTLEQNDLYDVSMKNDWSYILNNNHTLEAGAYATYYNIKYSYTQNGDDCLMDKRGSAVLLGLYAQDKIQLLNNRLTLTPGLRMSFYTLNCKPYFEPRVNGSYRLSSRFTVNAATGLFYQFANRIVREDIMSGNTDFWILSDGESVPVSRSWHFNVGVNYDLPGYIFGVEAYYKRNYSCAYSTDQCLFLEEHNQRRWLWTYAYGD